MLFRSDRERFQTLVRRLGIDESTTVVFYGDKSNWWATYAFWVFQLFGFTNAKVLDGGRTKWEQEGRPMTTESAPPKRTSYSAKPRNDAPIRAFMDDVRKHLRANAALVDVRSPDEFSGKLLAPAHLPQEQSQRAGHVPTAKNIPWSKAANDDGTFRGDEELKELYSGEGVDFGKDTIAYCRIGERSAHTWFVLHEILDQPNVKNYDGSWTEYGSLVGVPIEKDV